MRHANKVKKLGRTHAHRKATMAALSTALITHKRITTTLAKAKALRGFVEPIIHRAKDTSTNSRRLAFAELGQNKEAVKLLFGEVAEAMSDRPGGYTRVVKLGQRPGDAAEMAIIEIVDFNDVKPEGGTATKRKTRRSRSRSTGKAAGEGAPKAAKPAAEKAPAKAGGDDFTRLHGIGPVMAKALDEAGIRTYAQLAKADLYALRDAIQEHTKVSDESANEETWAAQAAAAARGDWAGVDAAAKAPPASATADESATEPASDEPASDEPVAEDQKAEAVASDGETPVEAGNPVVPLTPNADEHRDAEQGAAPGTGEPPPEAGPELRGRSGFRG
jgi:large subunit ribosomal protein L17